MNTIEYTTNKIRIQVPNDEEYIKEVEDILNNEVFLMLNDFIQHSDTTRLDHCVTVSYHSYLTAKLYNKDCRAAARAGLLHDLFLYDWHGHRNQGFLKLHGWTHPNTALQNASKEFELSQMEQEIIKKHMWPITIIPPKYFESYIVLWFDKICTLKEVLFKNRHKVSTRRQRKLFATNGSL